MTMSVNTANRVWRSALLALIAAVLSGCASRPINEPITKVDPRSGYRLATQVMKVRDNDSETLFVLAFSGGGTRAAAFAYGVLEELRQTPVIAPGGKRTLLDEVDVITGVSGGSFTALAYSLYGDRLFAEYEERFLKRNVQGALVSRTLNPFNWPSIMGGSAGRSELAAEYYDEILFQGATFNDLIGKPGPIAIAVATDVVTGARFPFLQDTFDPICSDVGTVRLSRAAAASSSVPVVLSPLTFNNYGGTCGYAIPSWAKEVLAKDDSRKEAERVRRRIQEILDLEDGKQRPYIHLIDGGVSDNLATRPVLEMLVTAGATKVLRETVLRNTKRIAIIVVNARSAPAVDWNLKEAPPGMVAQLFQSASVPIDRYSYESVELVKDIVARWNTERELAVAQARLKGMTEAAAEASVRRLDLFAVDIGFEAIADPKERHYFEELPTSFVLPPDAVDRLRAVAGRLMRDSPRYQELLRELKAEAPQKPAAALSQAD
ncbi:MAG: patatin-like phospholipase family protein [Burkholderiales bacterium]